MYTILGLLQLAAGLLFIIMPYKMTDLFFRNMHLPHHHEDIGVLGGVGGGGEEHVLPECALGQGCSRRTRVEFALAAVRRAQLSLACHAACVVCCRSTSHTPLFSAACTAPPRTADVLYEELWRVLGACFFAGAITCYALKVLAAAAGSRNSGGGRRRGWTGAQPLPCCGARRAVLNTLNVCCTCAAPVM
jgi:hypothetical protein